MESKQTCLVTGSSGYVGSRIAGYLLERGWEVANASRRQAEGASGNPFQFCLEDVPNSDVLAKFDALVHCAWDMRLTSWADIERININGSLKLFKNAAEAQVKGIIFISSISAFDGCVSKYGKSKLIVEKESAKFGVQSVRPGLVYGESAGGMVGKLSKTIDNSQFIPVVAPSKSMFLVHEEDLAELIYRIVVSENQKPIPPVIAACPNPHEFREILSSLATMKQRKVRLIPIPWQPVWLAIRVLETLGISLGFKSDSLLGLAYSNSNLVFSAAKEFGVNFRDFGNIKDDATESLNQVRRAL